MSAELIPTSELPTATVEQADDRPAIGSWWWVKDSGDAEDGERYDKPGKLWLACVIEVGSNYAKVEGVRLSDRIALDDFHDRCTSEPRPDEFISGKVGRHRERVRELMGEIRSLCHRLGVPMRQALAAAEESSQALAVVSGTSDVKAYEQALIKAKDVTLPELFKKVKAEHEQMATWMKAELIPAEAELSVAEETRDTIKGKIHTVELYAGLQERLEQVREGEPAKLDEKVHLMQRRHYMDEECLARYEAGGMDFQNIEAFDKWLGRDENFARIFPHLRCIVAFRVRRFDKDYGDLNPFISFELNNANKRTFLYIRNGQQLWRMETSIDFGEHLFPNKEDSDLLGDQDELWIKPDERSIREIMGVITGRQRDGMILMHKYKRKRRARQLKLWKAAGKPKDRWDYVADELDREVAGKTPGEVVTMHDKPGRWWDHDGADGRCPADYYVRLTPENIYHDDVMRKIQETAMEHNRLAVVLQGLLDRSTCLHPHPPWRLWTMEGFQSGIELVYDVSRALTPGEAPDFEGYRRQLNKSLKVGCHTIGQEDVWDAEMADKYGEKAWRYEGRHGKGPQRIDRVNRMKRDGSCEFRFNRSRARAIWVDHPKKPGYIVPSYPDIEMKWWCKSEHLTCVDAYTPGDFHMFYDDPRLRAEYLKWAPILLSCEDWHKAQRDKANQPPEPPDTDEENED